jgi:aminopeptidase YwaD
MTKNDLMKKSAGYLLYLCNEILERSVGSEGNRMATSFFASELSSLGWKTEALEFDAVDWHDGGATLTVDGEDFNVLVSPYSLGCSVEAELTSAKTFGDLQEGDHEGKILFLHGPLAKEQLMPKNFVFYNPDEHQKIVSLLENSGAKALVCATGRNAALAGGVYPFPLIEDGDFDIPSVYMTEDEGHKLLHHLHKAATLHSASERIPGKGYNVTGRKGLDGLGKVVVTAHIDAKKGTPGAIDNGSGVVIMLLLAGLLKDYSGERQIELVALNGEDYYAVPGQMEYIKANINQFPNIILNINIDGAGYKTGDSAFSFFGVPDHILNIAKSVMAESNEIVEGPPWPQGDHSIFVQYGRPAIAVSSHWFVQNIDSQDITHTPKDNIDIVDCTKLVNLAEALNKLIREL